MSAVASRSSPTAANVYEMTCEGRPLTIRVSCRDVEASSQADERYTVEASAADEVAQLDAIKVIGCGDSISAALSAVAEWWRLQEAALYLPHFDWSAIARALVARGALRS